MPITKLINTKAAAKQFTNNDIPSQGATPVIASYYATSTTSQTLINLPFSIVTTGSNANTDIFFLFVDGKKLDLGAGNDYVFSSVAADGTSSQVTVNYALPANLNIQAYKLGFKLESQFLMDNRFIALYEAQNIGFQGFVNSTSFINTATTTTGTPAAGTFYSTITNRASMVDLTQDLKVNLGGQRIFSEALYTVQNEMGPNGEPVFGVPGDVWGQIRFVGNWAPSANTNLDGVSVFTAAGNNTDYVEFTYYGTGVNLICRTSAAGQDIRPSINGAAETANIFGGVTFANIIAARNNGSNQIVPIVANQTLGLYTIKLRNNSSTGNQLLYGFEVLNESLNVKINPGVTYLAGQKLTNATLQSLAASAPVTGVRGGRVLVYQNADGTIGQAFRATNAAQANMASADHTNEEPVGRNYYRAYGYNRADDFSTNQSSTAARSFTLDDGTSNLMSPSFHVNTGISLDGGVISNGNFLIVTFVGTGLDVLLEELTLSAGRTESVTIDGGGSIGTIADFTTNPTAKYVKIVSGLPYGTHVVKFTNLTAGDSKAFRDFIIYQPKKPTIPTGAVELASYNVMATFAAGTTAGQTTIATGVLRKSPTREFSYIGTWSALGADYANSLQGIYATTSTNGDIAQITFLGTGFEYRFSQGTSAVTGTITVDGSTNVSGFSTSTYGASIASFTTSTGTFVTNTTSAIGNGIRVSGLTYGIHTVKLTKTAGANMFIDAFDIITPFHAYAVNQTEYMNSLPIGSLSVSDSRKFTAIKEIVTNKFRGRTFGQVSSPSTSSSVDVPMPDMQMVVPVNNPNGGWFRISHYWVSNTAANDVESTVYIDGYQAGIYTFSGGASGGPTFSVFDADLYWLSPGQHNVQIFWNNAGAGSITAQGRFRHLSVEEL